MWPRDGSASAPRMRMLARNLRHAKTAPAQRGQPCVPCQAAATQRRTVGRVHQRRLLSAKDEVGVVGGALRRQARQRVACIAASSARGPSFSSARSSSSSSTDTCALHKSAEHPPVQCSAAQRSAPPPARTRCQTGRGPAARQGRTAAESWAAVRHTGGARTAFQLSRSLPSQALLQPAQPSRLPRARSAPSPGCGW